MKKLLGILVLAAAVKAARQPTVVVAGATGTAGSVGPAGSADVAAARRELECVRKLQRDRERRLDAVFAKR